MKLGEIGLMTRDVCRLANFYRNLLGLPKDNDDPMHQELLSDPVSFAIVYDEAAGGGQNGCVAFTVNDVDAEHQRLLAMGVPIAQPPKTQPWGARNMVCLDPDGNRVYLRQFPAPAEGGPVRRLAEADRDTYLRLARAFYQTDAVLHPVPDAHLQATFDELMRSDAYVEGYLLLDDGQPAGYALLSAAYSQEAGGRVLWLEELFVLPEHRGKGLGKAFFAYLHEHRPAARYRLEVEPDNAEALHLYRSLGYRELPYLQMYKGE